MKKYIFVSLCCLALLFQGYSLKAQTATIKPNAPLNPAQLKTSPLAAYNNSTGGNGFTTGIINRVSSPLSLNPTQQKSMNTALYNFLNQKGGLNKLKWSDAAAYRQQANTLLQAFILQLGTFLSLHARQ